jgi:2-isopropylmalate synthase
VELLAREIRDAKLRIKPAAAARTIAADVEPIIEISQRLGMPLEVMGFIGSSTIRIYAEQWSLERLLQLSADAIALAVRFDLPCTFVTEDTARSHPEVLRPLFLNAIEHGAIGLCLCDTVGHATPDGVRALVRFTQEVCREAGADIRLDWHGHNDRGLALENALWAAEFGVQRIHGCALGIGERVGNASLDQLLLNMRLLGWIDNDLTKLVHFVRTVSAVTRVPIPASYPLAGSDAFRTGTGVHAAAVIKAQQRGDSWLADRIYSGVPASLFGREQEIEIGPMSGESNVVFWLVKRGVEPVEGLVKQIFDKAKCSNRLLSAGQIWQVIDEHRKQEPV